jgi:hypothetical protein
MNLTIPKLTLDDEVVPWCCFPKIDDRGFLGGNSQLCVCVACHKNKSSLTVPLAVFKTAFDTALTAANNDFTLLERGPLRLQAEALVNSHFALMQNRVLGPDGHSRHAGHEYFVETGEKVELRIRTSPVRTSLVPSAPVLNRLY